MVDTRFRWLMVQGMGRHFTYEEANDGDWSCRIFSTTEEREVNAQILRDTMQKMKCRP